MADDEHLAYGDYQGSEAGGNGASTDRGLVGDTFRKIRGPGGISTFLNKIQGAIQNIGAEAEGRIFSQGSSSSPATSQHRYGSFVGPQDGNDVKWYVDGCSYMWAVSIALEQARESVFILDCQSIVFASHMLYA